MEFSLKKTLITAISVVSLGVMSTLGHNIYTKKERVDITYKFIDKVDFFSTSRLLDSLDKAERVVGEGETYTLEITSPGGIVRAFDEVMYRLNKTKLHVITRIRAGAASAAAMMFVLGEERVMSDKATILFHYARNIFRSNIGNVVILEGDLERYLRGDTVKDSIKEVLDIMKKKNVKKMYKELKDMNDDLRQVLLSIFSKDVVNKLLIKGKDVVLTGKEALKLGVATSLYNPYAPRKASK